VPRRGFIEALGSAGTLQYRGVILIGLCVSGTLRRLFISARHQLISVRHHSRSFSISMRYPSVRDRARSLQSRASESLSVSMLLRSFSIRFILGASVGRRDFRHRFVRQPMCVGVRSKRHNDLSSSTRIHMGKMTSSRPFTTNAGNQPTSFRAGMTDSETTSRGRDRRADPRIRIWNAQTTAMSRGTRARETFSSRDLTNRAVRLRELRTPNND